MPNELANDYLLGDSDPELARLRLQHALWAEETTASWRRAGIAEGASVLEIGAGPGFTALELAQRVGPQGRIVALDQSTRFNEHLERRARAMGVSNVVAVSADVRELDLEERFDVIYARWVFCFLGDASKVVERAAAHLRPGGRMVVTDYFNYRAFCVAPRIPGMADIVAAVESSWADAGGSLEVQGQMPQWMAAAGLQLRLIRPITRVVSPGDPLWGWPRDFLRSYLPRLIDSGLLEERQVTTFWKHWNTRERQAGSYLFLPPMIEVHACKS